MDALLPDDVLGRVFGALLLDGDGGFDDDGAGAPAPPWQRSNVGAALRLPPHTNLYLLRERCRVAGVVALVCGRWRAACRGGGDGDDDDAAAARCVGFGSLAVVESALLAHAAFESDAGAALARLAARCRRVWVRCDPKWRPGGVAAGDAAHAWVWRDAFPRARCVSLKNCLCAPELLAALAGRGFPPLLALDVSGTAVDDAGLAAVAAAQRRRPSLTSLSVYGCGNVTGAGLGAFAAAPLPLRRLSVGANRRVAAEHVGALAASARATLRELDASRVSRSALGFGAAVAGRDPSACAAAAGLAFDRGGGGGGDAAPTPPLALTWGDGPDVALDDDFAALAAARVPSLVERDVRGVAPGPDYALRVGAVVVVAPSAPSAPLPAFPSFVARHGPHLRRCAIRGCRGFGDDEAIALFEGAPLLAHAALPRSRVGDGALRRLGALAAAGRLRELRDLDLDGCAAITDAGLEALADGARGLALEALSVARCRKLTDAGLVAVLAGGLRALERLHADECPRLTSACLAPLRDASGCPRLATLSLRGLRSHRRVTLAAVDEVRSVRLGLEIHGSFAAVLYR